MVNDCKKKQSLKLSSFKIVILHYPNYLSSIFQTQFGWLASDRQLCSISSCFCGKFRSLFQNFGPYFPSIWSTVQFLGLLDAGTADVHWVTLTGEQTPRRLPLAASSHPAQRHPLTSLPAWMNKCHKNVHNTRMRRKIVSTDPACITHNCEDCGSPFTCEGITLKAKWSLEIQFTHNPNDLLPLK